MTTNKPETGEHLRTLEKRASEAIAEAYRLRRLWEFSAAMISANEKKIKPRGRDEERLLDLAKSADHGMAWSGRTDGWLDAGMGRPAAPEDSAAELERMKATLQRVKDLIGPYLYGGSNFREPASQAIALIDAAIQGDNP